MTAADLDPLTTRVLDGRLQGFLRGIEQQLTGLRRIGVAFSGGVDSTTLLAVVARVLGPTGAVAILGDSDSLAGRERQEATALARLLQVELVTVATREMQDDRYRRNNPDRCFHCKNELFTRIDSDVIGAWRLDAVAYGEIVDDQQAGDRPGLHAAARHRVLRPLATAGMSKKDVRALARALGLPNWDKPAAPCLASRIPFYSEVNPAKLAQVEAAEDSLHRLGLVDVRVRHRGELAVVELPPDALEEAEGGGALRERIEAGVRAAGFGAVNLSARITIRPADYRREANAAREASSLRPPR